MNTVAESGLDERGGGDVDSAFGSLSSSQVRTLTLCTDLGQAVVLGDGHQTLLYLCLCVCSVCVCGFSVCFYVKKCALTDVDGFICTRRKIRSAYL